MGSNRTRVCRGHHALARRWTYAEPMLLHRTTRCYDRRAQARTVVLPDSDGMPGITILGRSEMGAPKSNHKLTMSDDYGCGSDTSGTTSLPEAPIRVGERGGMIRWTLDQSRAPASAAKAHRSADW